MVRKIFAGVGLAIAAVVVLFGGVFGLSAVVETAVAVGCVAIAVLI